MSNVDQYLQLLKYGAWAAILCVVLLIVVIYYLHQIRDEARHAHKAAALHRAWLEEKVRP